MRITQFGRSESKASYLLLHGDEVVAESTDDSYADWKVYKPSLLPCGIKLYRIQQVEEFALKKAGYDGTKLLPFTKEEMQNRDKIRDRARDKARDWNVSKINTWLSRRVLPLSRENAKIVCQHLGLEQHKTEIDRAGIAARFSAVSVTDNYWMKKSTDNNCWANVDVRRIPLSEGFALISLTGNTAVTLSSIDDLTDRQAAAEVGTTGTYPKGCFRKDGKLYIVKGGSEHDVIAEWLSARILSCTNVYGYCDYQLDDGTGSNGFPKTGILSAYCEVMSNTERDLIMASSLFENAEQIALNRFRQQFAQIAVVDYLIGNIDRHSGNWGFFSEAPDWKFTGLHDIYDNNRSFGQLSYRENGVQLKASIAGRGTPQQKTLEEGAMMYKNEAGLRFIKPVRKEWFRMFGTDCNRYVIEFCRRCNQVNLDPMLE